MKNRKIKFGLVGCGRIGNRHVEHMNAVGEIVGACDVSLERAEQAIGSEGLAFEDLGVMLESIGDQIDLVAVCTPNGLHCEHTLQVLQAGCHVLCEKPMALSSRDCGRMIHAAEHANRRLFVVKQNRFNPPVVAVREAIENGKLGQIHSVSMNCFWNRNSAYYDKDSWKGSLKMDGGVLYTQFSHFVDLLYWLLGDVKHVSAIARNQMHEQTVEFEDCGAALLDFENGALGSINYTINSYGKNMEGSITLFGELGTVKIGGQYLNELEYQNIENLKIENVASSNPPNLYGHYVGSMSNHRDVYENVISVLQQDGVIATNGFEGMKTVEIIEKIYNCSR